MKCPRCAQHVNDALASLSNVTVQSVNHETGTADITCHSDITDKMLIEVITKCGYTLRQIIKKS